ncbi:hypothetical protein [Alkalimonas sp.]|uniref:hypothetical protein n=1 Tax=Alkalimonas sp. TaxID=1872453 RepID=UPI00263AC933|nr:hypothetical protein [Alkalimonas sp.]MCC5827409.1 hypothetical protein [Alkalimonas sp.]
MEKLTGPAIALISVAVLLGNSAIAEATTNYEAEKKTVSYVQVIADENSSLLEEVRADIQRDLSHRIRDALRELPLSLNRPG